MISLSELRELIASIRLWWSNIWEDPNDNAGWIGLVMFLGMLAYMILLGLSEGFRPLI